jgi:hypothetical protein
MFVVNNLCCCGLLIIKKIKIKIFVEKFRLLAITNVLYLISFQSKPVEFRKSDEDCIDVDSHLNVAEVPTEEEICNAIMNPQTI